MTKLIRGDQLPAEARREALSAYGYRWTAENVERAVAWHRHSGSYRGRLIGPLITDSMFLQSLSFAVTKVGRLARNVRHARPAFMAD